MEAHGQGSPASGGPGPLLATMVPSGIEDPLPAFSWAQALGIHPTLGNGYPESSRKRREWTALTSLGLGQVGRNKQEAAGAWEVPE